MDWIKENRFYAGYAAVMLVGILALGFWVFKGWSGYNAALNDYKSTDDSVRKLSDEKIFPSQDHLDEKEAMVAVDAAWQDRGLTRDPTVPLDQQHQALGSDAAEAGLAVERWRAARTALEVATAEPPGAWACGLGLVACP